MVKSVMQLEDLLSKNFAQAIYDLISNVSLLGIAGALSKSLLTAQQNSRFEPVLKH